MEQINVFWDKIRPTKENFKPEGFLIFTFDSCFATHN
jgi:hypothetical protein